ncbi:MAG: methyl-accepting chemotaxis protein, partial [Bosea sp. (in: a-proteobacteria)]
MLRRESQYLDRLDARVKEFGPAVEGTAIPDSSKETIRNNLVVYQNAVKAWASTAIDLSLAMDSGDAAYGIFEPLLNDVDKAIEAFRAETDKALVAEQQAIATMIWTVFGLCFVIVTILVLIIGSSISKPINAMTSAIQSMGNGELDVRLPSTGEANELGQMADAIDSFKTKLVARAVEETQRDVARNLEQAAQRKADANRLADTFENSVGQIVAQVSALSGLISAASIQLTGSAEVTQTASEQVVSASEEASANALSVANASEEMSVAINDINMQIIDTNTLAAEASEVAHHAEGVGSDLVRASAQISEAVELIRKIAAQTNLLALNATIEAARAGDAGRGFAVVASEVKMLANQTAAATDTISNYIADVRKAADSSVSSIDQVSTKVTRLSEVSMAIASAVSQQSAVTLTIARDVQYVANASEVVSNKISQVNTQAAQTGLSAHELAQTSESLL